MTHIVDETYKGHELVFLQDNNGLIAVDIRADNFDGAFLQGYCDLLCVSDARNKAVGYIDGYKQAKDEHLLTNVPY